MLSLLTCTIFSHWVPLPAPGLPRTNITIGFAALDIIRLAASDISATKHDKCNIDSTKLLPIKGSLSTLRTLWRDWVWELDIHSYLTFKSRLMVGRLGRVSQNNQDGGRVDEVFVRTLYFPAMFFPIGWPKYFSPRDVECGELLALKYNRDRSLLAVISSHSVCIWNNRVSWVRTLLYYSGSQWHANSDISTANCEIFFQYLYLKLNSRCPWYYYFLSFFNQSMLLNISCLILPLG